MKIELLLLFIALCVFLFVGNMQISNFSFISKNKNTIEINNPVVINKEQNMVDFKDINDNAIRVNKICIHDTRKNNINCLKKEDLALAKDLPDLRHSMACIGDECISELHAGLLNGDYWAHIKTDPLGKTSLECQTLHTHKANHHKDWRVGGLNLEYSGMIPSSNITINNNRQKHFDNQLFKLEGIDRKPSGDPIAFGASLGSRANIPVNSLLDNYNNSIDQTSNMF
jgi:hypothetical protein